MVMKTPGVYVVEKDPFPTAVAEVATAVPAFIGYTERADANGRDLTGRPWRITSMAEYERHFGGAPQPRLRFEAVASPGHAPAPVPDLQAPRAQVAEFEVQGRTYRLTRAAGADGRRHLLHAAMRLFFANGGGPCVVVSVGRHDDTAGIEAGDATRGLIGGLKPLLGARDATMVVVPDAVLLSRADCVAVQQAVLTHCSHEMRNRVAILDVWGGELPPAHAAGDCVDAFRRDIGTEGLGYAAAYYPWLHTSLMPAKAFRPSMVDDTAALAAAIAAELRIDPAEALDEARLATSPLYDAVCRQAATLVNLMPPSAAMAGVYTRVDNTRGVWQAPANVALSAVVEPAVPISRADQENLNVDPQGRSVNAIRRFVGEGVLVWGARTLDGNSLEWRYVNVRRTMIMLEESCRVAVGAMVFEPNAASTWAAIKGMLGNFLTDLWKRGGLAGAAPDDAFGVRVGLGETMTADDIRNGVLRVTVMAAVSRPAEFIVFTIAQKMQTS